MGSISRKSDHTTYDPCVVYFPTFTPWTSTTCREKPYTIHGSYRLYSILDLIFDFSRIPTSQHYILESNSKFFEHKVCEVTQFVCRLDKEIYNQLQVDPVPSIGQVCLVFLVQRRPSLLADGDAGPYHGPVDHPHLWNPPLQKIPVPEFFLRNGHELRHLFLGPATSYLNSPRKSRVRPRRRWRRWVSMGHMSILSWDSARVPENRGSWRPRGCCPTKENRLMPRWLDFVVKQPSFVRLQQKYPRKKTSITCTLAKGH